MDHRNQTHMEKNEGGGFVVRVVITPITVFVPDVFLSTIAILLQAQHRERSYEKGGEKYKYLTVIKTLSLHWISAKLTLSHGFCRRISRGIK